MSREISVGTGWGTNYKGGVWNAGYGTGGSHMVGWDNGDVRAEVFEFETGDWPVTHLHWDGPSTTLDQGNAIPIRYILSTSEGTYVDACGEVSGSHELDQNTRNDLDVSLSPRTTYYITFFPGTTSGTGGGFGLYWIGTDFPGDTFTMYMLEQDYTPCTAPTSVSVSPAIQTPGSNSTLSWSGATAGTNLTIGSYDIYRATSASGTYSYLGNTTSTSYSVAAPSAGSYYYYKIVTKPSQSVTGYDSPLSSASNGLKGNTVPGAPTVSANKTLLPSAGGNVTFTATPGSDPDGQTLTLYYASSTSGTKYSFTSPLSLGFSPNSPKTYYFYTYDGLAYSSPVSITITLNVKPVISGLTYQTLGSYTALGGDGATGYQQGYACNIAPKITVSEVGTVTIELEYYSSDATTTWDSSSVTRVTMLQTSISSTSGVILNSCNIHQYITLGATNVHWRIRAKINDGIEDSDSVYFPSASSGQYYAIAHASPLLASYNQFANSDIIGTNTGDVWRNVRMKVYNDTSVPVATASAVVNGLTLTATAVSSVDGVYRYVDVTLPDGIASEATIAITAALKDSGNTIAKNTNATVKETKLPTMSALSHGAGTIKPFSDTGDFEITTVWPFGLYETLDSTTLAAYNCSTTVANVIKLVYSTSGSGSGANRITKDLTWVKDADTLTTTMGREDAYDWDHTLGISTYGGAHNYYCRLEITNLFGKVNATEWVQRTFNFAEPVQSPTITSIDWSLDGATNWGALGNDAIQEGVYLRINCSFGLFTTDDVTVSILLTNTTGERSIACAEEGSPTKITPVTYLSTELSRATGRTPASNTKSYIYHITNEIADTVDRQWRLQFVNSGYTTNSSYVLTPVIRQCAPSLVLDNCETDEDYKLYYTYSMTDLGFDSTNVNNSVTNYISDGTSRLASTAILNTVGSGIEGEIQSTVTGWEAKPICVEMVSVVSGLYTHTKTYYSNVIIVYAVSPTVAYRKNKIGMNTDAPASGTIVDIHQSTKRKTILIQGYTQDFQPTKFEIDVSTGQIKFYLNGTVQHTLDLMNGTLT